jgi:hypothetical protein
MPPVRTQVACPNCRMPVTTSLEQVFDVSQDPSAKQRFLSGRFNLIDCPNCHYQGQVSSPLLYHDPDKELLMSLVPMELGLPQMEQEKLLGRLMNEVISKLPPEKRKGYLLNPKPAFTLQGMLERVLEAEGVTKEMLDAQRAKVQLLQTLLSTPDEQVPDVIRQHDAEIDATLMQMLSASAEATANSGNQAGASKMAALQNHLLEHSTFGGEVRQRQQTLQSVAQELQALGRKLTPDKLLELVVNAAGDDDRLAAYVSFARPAMDYAFFEALTRRIDRAKSPDKEGLAAARDKLLEMTRQIDQAAQAQMADATTLLRTLMEAPDPRQAVMDNLPRIDETFLNVLNVNIEAAQRAKRQDVVDRLMVVSDAVMNAMQEAAPPELRLINELLQMPSADEAEAALRRRASEINQDLVDTMTYIGDNLRQSGQTALAERLDKLRSVAVGVLMKANWQK